MSLRHPVTGIWLMLKYRFVLRNWFMTHVQIQIASYPLVYVYEWDMSHASVSCILVRTRPSHDSFYDLLVLRTRLSHDSFGDRFVLRNWFVTHVKIQTALSLLGYVYEWFMSHIWINSILVWTHHDSFWKCMCITWLCHDSVCNIQHIENICVLLDYVMIQFVIYSLLKIYVYYLTMPWFIL